VFFLHLNLEDLTVHYLCMHVCLDEVHGCTQLFGLIIILEIV